ncbi:uncharacterized protein [Watersipora subatra]|uniref:uncharacterized protein n=1 Tax=Watersipora subatra TaxID=2589382 RepID=UPI00355BB8A5
MDPSSHYAQGHYRNEEVDEKFYADSRGQMVDIYPREYDHAPVHPHTTYYDMAYPSTHLEGPYSQSHHPVYSSYYDPPQQYPAHPQEYDQYHMEPHSHPSYRQPSYPSKYHPSPPQPQLAYKKSRYSNDEDDDSSQSDEKLSAKKEKPFQTYMCWSFISFIFCWGLFGAVAMINSFEAKQKHKQGDEKGATKHQRCAKWLNIIATITGLAATGVTLALLLINRSNPHFTTDS